MIIKTRDPAIIMFKKTSAQLKENRKKLNLKYEKQPSSFYMLENARLLDDYFRDTFEASNVGPTLSQKGFPFTVVALGGFGRAEQCVFSDVDIMFLFEKRIPTEAEELIKEVIYPLWDIGLDIGHATRTVDECILLANQDLEILTSLLDGRFICGMSPLYHKLTDSLINKTKSNRNKFTTWIKDSSTERHKLFGDSSGLLEPDLKNGMGGLRDYHAMLWLGKIKGLINQPEDFVNKGFLLKNEYDNLKESLDFIWMVRNLLHIVSKRKNDQLFFEYHEPVADILNIEGKNDQKPVERFIGRLHKEMELVKQHHLMFLSETGHKKNFFIHKNMFKRSRFADIVITNTMLDFTSKRAVEKKPERLLQIFLESARLQFPLCSAAKRMVADSVTLIEKIRNTPTAVSLFEKIMHTASDEFNVLNEMLSTNFLANFIPEFDKITNRIQYNQYHIYPVDRHSIRVLQEVRNFVKKENVNNSPLYGELYVEITSKKVLHWAALLHDIGKGTPDREHSAHGADAAREILSQKGLNNKHIDEISFLIENHLFLINVAKRRDIDDEETAISCARKIQSVNRLKMLYLLTIADSISTGPNAWNEWTEGLLRGLFFKTLEILNSGDFASVKKEKALEKKRDKIISLKSEFSLEKDELEKIISGMSHRYLMHNSEDEIIRHLSLYNRMRTHSTPFCLDIQKQEHSESRTATFTGDVVPGLFSKIAGTLTLNNYDILDAQIFSWGRKAALDIFTVKPFYEDPHEEAKWQKISTDLGKVLSNEIDLVEALKNKNHTPGSKKQNNIAKKADRIVIDNDSSSFFTIIEIYTYDYPGLLFAVTNALYNKGIDIVYAKITTHVDQVVDVFYVRELNGGKIYAPDLLDAIKGIRLTELL